MSIQVIAPGVLTTVQDRGRFGYLASGITEGGAMDQKAYARANGLVGNENGEAVLECTLMGPELLFTSETVAALTGADMSPVLDGEPVPMDRAFPVKSGQTLKLGMASKGLRSYLAVSGGIDVPLVLGSRSTNLKCRLGGFEGRKLAAGDVLPVGAFVRKPDRIVRPYHPVSAREITVRCVPGPQEEYFTEKGIETFYRTAYTVTPESDRMGMRLSGEKIETVHGSDIVSDGIVFGSVQVPKSGLPIILMADHQTAGGYAKIATVISDDLPVLAQAAPGTMIHFAKIPVEEAQKAKEERTAPQQKTKKEAGEKEPVFFGYPNGWGRFHTWKVR